MLSSGLIDLQVNGFAGVDFNSGTITAAGLDRALEAMLATGVTACLPTIITARPGELEQRFVALDRAVTASRLGPLMCPGYHLEGPFLNPAPGYHGCHPPEAMTGADMALVERLQGLVSRPILLVTLAPEIKGGMALVGALARSGRVVAIGHSAVDFALAEEAADAGATLSTHLGNGLPQQMHKLDNAVFAQLAEDRLWASFIPDGIHIHRKALGSLLRAKGMARSILVTDAISAAASPPGRYTFAGMSVERGADGAVRQPGGIGLAGSALCLDQGVRNLVAWELATPQEAIAMASSHPHALLEAALARFGITLDLGEIEWSQDLAVRQVRLGDIERRFAA